VTGRRSRRRLRVRRKRKDESFGSRLLDSVDAVEVGGMAAEAGAYYAPQVVGRLGCCVVEAIGSAAVLAALLTVPAYLLIR
jgi:hypothetical protein